ncbi:MAG: hypothetical protein KBC22_03220 [Candidatus Pacebacteria bacterium]|nr:hypothetical protein [Candidatus Paceibacterota bacterium]
MSDISLKRFFPVVHCVYPSHPFEKQGIKHAIANTKIAMGNFADGIFLIGHAVNYGQMCHIYENVRKQFPDIWIGINFLDVTVLFDDGALLTDLVKDCLGLNGLWLDHLPIHRLLIDSSIEVFGGVAFKYIDPDIRGEQLKKSCDQAAQLVDVITTSGTKTGSAPDVAKLEEIRRNIGNEKRLALASGVTLENVSLFLPTVSDFLVASSITERVKDFGNHEYLIPEKVLALATQIHR